MQLNKRKSIRNAVTAVTAALLGSSAATAGGVNQSETSFLVYSEHDRVKTTEGIFSLTKQLRHNYTLGLRLTYDGLTGATPTGASPSKNPQTLTRASGRSGYVVPAGELPTDQYFKDTRMAVDADLTRPLGRLTTITVGGHASHEHDYTSTGVNAGFTRDFNQKNSTVGVSFAYSHDVSSPVGGIPVPFSVLAAAGTTRNSQDSRTKKVYDVVVSLTQVLDQKTIVRVNYSLDRSSGYLTDPYKLISIVQAPDSADAGEPVQSLHEYRPDTRNKNALYGEVRRFLLGSTVDLSYRYFWDDWGVTSHAADCYVRLDFKRNGAIRPHVRWYRQSRADFYSPYLVQGTALPRYASADSRLARFDALTYGLNYNVPVSANSRLSFTAEVYSQRGDRSPPEAFGTVRNYNLFPDLRAMMLSLGLIHSF